MGREGNARWMRRPASARSILERASARLADASRRRRDPNAFRFWRFERAVPGLLGPIVPPSLELVPAEPPPGRAEVHLPGDLPHSCGNDVSFAALAVNQRPVVLPAPFIRIQGACQCIQTVGPLVEQ